MRPDDVPSWKESTRRSWFANRFLLLIIPFSYAMAIAMPELIFLEPTSAKQASEIQAMTDFMKVSIPCVAAFMWLLMFLLGITGERAAKTPKEIEAKERAILAALKEKYGE